MIIISNQLDDAISINDLITAVRAIGDQSLKSNDGVKQAISDLNYKIVQPAIVSANETAKRADKLGEQSKVHDEAIKAQDEALAAAQNNINGALSNARTALAEVRQAGTIQAADHRDLVANQQALDQLTTALASQSAETVVVKQTASEASVTAKGANEAAVQAKVTAASAQTIATNASSDAIVATQTAQEAKTVATNAQGAVSVMEQTATSLSQRVSGVENSISSAQTQINQNKNDISLKADKTTVNALSNTVTQQSAALKTASDSISSKVWKSDITSATNGLATQNYVDTSVKQTANAWSLNLQSLQTKIDQSVTNLTATVDGLQSTVKSKADSSTVTQLKNALQSKVESSTYTSAISQLSDDINLRVKSDELLSQINLAAGRTLIDSKKIVLNADSVIFSAHSKAFIPDAAISSLAVDKLTSGTIDTNKLRISNGSTNMVFDNRGIGIDSDGFISRQGSQSYDFYQGNNSNWTYRIASGKAKYASQAEVSGLNLFSNQGLGSSTQVGSANFDATKNPKLSISDYGVTVAPSLFFQNADQSKTTWMGFTRNREDEGLLFHSGNDEGEMFQVASGARFQKYLYINGYARAQGWLNNSELSKKTNVQPLDGAKALELIRQDDMYTYEYTQNLKEGISDPQASFIIDDVNQVSKYRVPREFIDNTGHYREMGVELSYLIAAFQELDRQVQDLRKKETN